MTNTQEQLVFRQRQMQQRQILAMMGIEQWVGSQSATVNVASIALTTVAQPTLVESDIEQETLNSAIVPPTMADYNGADGSSIYNADSPNVYNADEHSPVTKTPVTDEFASNTISASMGTDTHNDNDTAMQTNMVSSVAQLVAPLVESATVATKTSDITETDTPKKIMEKVAPFTLQGGRYGNWVLLVDIQNLNNDCQKLWQNITQALSISCETTSFPICAGMDDTELANASLAGYIFKIGRSEEVKVVALTELPRGLLHPNLESAPMLHDMLADSTLKRTLWEKISN